MLTGIFSSESTDHGSNESDTESETSAPNTPHIPLSEADAVSFELRVPDYIIKLASNCNNIRY